MTEFRTIFLNGSAQPGGGEIALAELASAVPGGRILLLEGGPAEELFRSRGLEVQVHPISKRIRENTKESGIPGPRLMIEALGQIWRLSRQMRDVDLVHCNNQKAWVLGAFASWLARRPVVWHLHDILSKEHFSKSKIRLVVWLANFRASRVIANSKASADAFVAAGGKREIVEVVHNPISPEPFLQAQPIVGFRESIGCMPDEPVYGIFSRLASWKGQHVAIQALARQSTGHLVLVGAPLFAEEAYEAELKALVSRLNLDGRVHFLGFRKDIPALLASIDLAMHTSIVAEPFGLVILEAQLAGKPVVATAAGGALEIVEDDISGWLVPPGDIEALSRVMAYGQSDPDRLRRLGTSARVEALKKFDAEILRTRFLRILESVAAG
jgi:glycosyltransferase involved in cell wall biosynthesis